MNRLRMLWRPRLIIALVLALVLLGVGSQLLKDSRTVTITAYFSSTEGLYVGDDVKVLGVRVGRVTEVESEGDRVRVEVAVDAGQPVPADASAVIVAPSLVTGRFVQLEPAWSGGKRLSDGGVIDQQRTAVPVSFDDVKRQLTDLSTVLGPQKGSGRAPLAEAIRTVQRNLRNGNSADLRASLTALHRAADDLSDNKSDLFRTISNLDSFTRNLAVNDAAVRGFSTELASVGKVLSNNRTQLTGAIRDLRRALRVTDDFLIENRTRIKATTRSANDLAAAVADRSNELAGALHVAPTALIDLHHIIENQAITGRATLSHLDSVAQLVCGAILGVGGAEKACVQAIQPLLGIAGPLGSLLPAPPTGPAGPGGTTPPEQPARTGLLDNLLGQLGLLNGGGKK